MSKPLAWAVLCKDGALRKHLGGCLGFATRVLPVTQQPPDEPSALDIANTCGPHRVVALVEDAQAIQCSRCQRGEPCQDLAAFELAPTGVDMDEPYLPGRIGR